MDNLLDLIMKDESPSQISDKIKDVLFTKSADKIENLKPSISNSVFDETEPEEEEEV